MPYGIHAAMQYLFQLTSFSPLPNFPLFPSFPLYPLVAEGK
jgi:hypothetical protein